MSSGPDTPHTGGNGRTPSSDPNRAFAEKLIRRLDPSYCQRWEIYDGILKRLAGPDARWLDGGCGRNVAVAEFPCALNVGIDVYPHPELCRDPGVLFVLGDLARLPFRDGAFTMVSLNTVAEHFRDPETVFREIRRVLQPGGRLLIHTTNIRSPLILLGKLLPQSLRVRLFTRALGAQEDDVFPAYHRSNTVQALQNIEEFQVEEFHAVQDLNWTRRSLFLGLLLYHLLTRFPGLWRLRTNFVALLRKTE
ncbi:MAG: class I SAM-dependent methyltransferase [Candidatus Latescibacterota bacterium]